MTSSCGIWDFRRQIDGAKSTGRFGSRDGAVSFAVQRSHAAEAADGQPSIAPGANPAFDRDRCHGRRDFSVNAAAAHVDRSALRRPVARAGHRRSFNKKSVESRGTPEVPGLTLNLVRAAGYVCRGIAFAFGDDDRAPEMLRDLQRREACKPRALAVHLEDGRTVTA